MIFKRDVVCLDLETTGTDVANDRIVEICIRRYEGGLDTPPSSILYIVNPMMEIPKGASDVHGITNETVKDCPPFKAIAQNVMNMISGCDVIGFNSNNFDAPLLYNELNRAGIIWDYSKVNFIDVCNIFKIKEARTLSAAVKFYLNQEHEGAHGADADVRATVDVLLAQINKYGLDDMRVEELALMSSYDKKILDLSGKFSEDKDGDIIFNFGAHKGKKAKTEKNYLNWMIDKGNFSPDTISIAKKIIK